MLNECLQKYCVKKFYLLQITKGGVAALIVALPVLGAGPRRESMMSLQTVT